MTSARTGSDGAPGLPEPGGPAPSGRSTGALPPLVMPGPYSSVTERLAEVADLLPDRPALVAADGELTHGQLRLRVDRLAGELVAALSEGAGPAASGRAAREPIGILADQGAASVAAMLAVIAAGHPCVVLDVLFPPDRLALIVEQAGIAVVLADDERRAVAGGLPGVRHVGGLLPDAAAADPPSVLPPVGLDDPATVVFTSGSTGAPKGVVWTHRTLLGTGHTTREMLRLTPEDRVSLVVPVSFAVGQECAFGALLNGAAVCIRDPRVHGIRDVAEWLRDDAAPTVLSCTPSLLRALGGALGEGERLASVRLATTAGEKVYGDDVAGIRRRLGPGAGFLNWMGSSETGPLTSFRIDPEDPVPDGPVPIGRGVPLRDLEILDADDEPVAPGQVGALHVTSAHLSGGYWGEPDRTAARFSPLPDGRTRYCTGDRARRGADGVIEILGRGDDAVKIRGYLVEPGEVEAALRRLPGVVDAVVRGSGAGEQVRLVTWVVVDPSRERPAATELRTELNALLPEWMVPRDVVFLEELPRNERGKLDVGALPAPPERADPTAPATPSEAAVERVWATILDLDHVGREESFTALGGESLGIEEMLTQLEEEFSVRLLAEDLTRHPTLAEFAAFLDARRADRSGREGGGDRVAAARRLVGRLVRRGRPSGAD